MTNPSVPIAGAAERSLEQWVHPAVVLRASRKVVVCGRVVREAGAR